MVAVELCFGCALHGSFSAIVHRLLASLRMGWSVFQSPCFHKRSKVRRKKFRLVHVGRKKSLLKAGLEVDAVEGPASHRPVNVLLEETSVRLKRSEKVELVIFGFAKSSSHKNDCF